MLKYKTAVTKLKCCQLVAVALFNVVTCFSQSYSFVNYTTDDGLPTSQIYQVFMDQRGYIWFTSDAGIGKFEMGRIQVLSKKDNLPDNTVFSLTQNRSDTLLGTCYNNRLFELDVTNARVSSIKQKFYDLFQKSKYVIFQTHAIDDSIFVNTNLGLFYASARGNDSARRRPIHPAANIEITLRQGTALLNTDNQVGKSNILGLETPDSVRVLLNYQSGKRWFSFARAGKSIFHYNFRVFYVKQFQAVALLFADHLHLFYEDGQHVLKKFPSELISLFTDRGGDFWIGTRSNGAYVFRNSDISREPENLLPACGVSSFCNDLERGLWLSTINKGIFYLPSKTFKQFVNPTLGKEILHLDQAKDHLFVLGSGGEVVRLAAGQVDALKVDAFRNYHDKALSYLKAYKGNLYVFGRSECIYTTGDLQRDLIGKRYAPEVRCLVIDKNDSLWMLDYMGLSKVVGHFDSNIGVVTHTLNAYGLAMDADGKMVLGTMDGLLRYDGSGVKPVAPYNTVLRNRIDYVFIDRRGRYWLSINGIGLGILDKNEFYLIPLSEAGINTKVSSVIEHGKSYWTGTKNGLFRVTLNERNGKIIGHRFDYFSRNDGLISNEIRELASFNGQLVIATNKGLCYASFIDLDRPRVSPPIYAVLRDSVGVSWKGGAPTFASDVEKVVVWISQPSYRAFQNTAYCYKLLGAKDSFIERSPAIVLENLKYGKYTVRVNNYLERFVGGSVAEISFEIEKSFWLQMWFIGLCGIVLIVLVLLFIRLRVLRMRRTDHEKMKIQKLLNEYKMSSLQAQMNPHFIFNAINSIQQYILTSQSDTAYDYLARFGKLIRLVLEMSRSNYTSLSKEVELLNLYMELEQVRSEHGFDYSVVVQKQIDANAVTIPIMIIQPHIENAIWHGIAHLKDRRGVIVVSIRDENSLLIISIKDNGVGREVAGHYGRNNRRNYQSLSTKINQERLQLFESTLEVIDLFDSEGKSSGTEVIIKLAKTDE